MTQKLDENSWLFECHKNGSHYVCTPVMARQLLQQYPEAKALPPLLNRTFFLSQKECRDACAVEMKKTNAVFRLLMRDNVPDLHNGAMIIRLLIDNPLFDFSNVFDTTQRLAVAEMLTGKCRSKTLGAFFAGFHPKACKQLFRDLKSSDQVSPGLLLYVLNEVDPRIGYQSQAQINMSQIKESSNRENLLRGLATEYDPTLGGIFDLWYTTFWLKHHRA